MTPADRLRGLLDAERLPPEPPPELLREAHALAERPLDEGLTDLRALPFVTIDEPHSRDLDQALLVEPDGQGHVVWYALADAGAYVLRGTALFEDTLRRGTSFYLPGLTVPMLPRALSEGAVSLLPDADRQALVFRMTVDPDGACTGTRVEHARIRSRAKLTYTGVQGFYDGAARIDDPVATSLRALAVLGRRRAEGAYERAVVRYHRRELEVGVAGDGLRFVAREDLRRDVERWNEQVSVLCNVEGGRWLREARGAQPIFRVHPPPEPVRIAKLERLLRQLARAHGLPGDWAWDPRSESLAAYLERIPEEGPHGRLAAAIHRQAVVSNGEASYRAVPGAHHGLGAEVYARFTAPMREVVGIWLHQEALAVLEGRDNPDDDGLRDRVIAAAEAANDRQKRLDRAVNRLVLDQLLGDAREAGAALPGTVLGLAPDKVHVRLDEPPVDVKVYVRHLERAHGALTVGAVAVRAGRRTLARLGDPVRVRVTGRDERDRWVLALEKCG